MEVVQIKNYSIRPGLSAGNPRHPGRSKGVLYSPNGEPVLYASVAAPPGQSRGRQVKKELLAALLEEHSPAGRLRNPTLAHNRLGRPHLLVDGAPGPAVSFSWSAGAWWAALGTSKSWIGLDAASPKEFTGTYPLHKVFGAAEWQAANLLTGGEREEAAALLWTVKEAMVKARGWGYHFCGPRQVRVELAGPGEQGPCWRGHLEGPFPDPGPQGSQDTLSAVSIRLDRVWLSVAWMPVPEG